LHLWSFLYTLLISPQSRQLFAFMQTTIWLIVSTKWALKMWHNLLALRINTWPCWVGLLVFPACSQSLLWWTISECRCSYDTDSLRKEVRHFYLFIIFFLWCWGFNSGYTLSHSTSSFAQTGLEPWSFWSLPPE
jgi:hypothetical protein